MNKSLIFHHLTTTFLEELKEHVRALNQDLMTLEKGPTAEKTEVLHRLFRTFHSLKGGARSMGQRLVEEVCHHAEQITTAAKEGRLPFDSDLFHLFFSTVDVIEELGTRLHNNENVAGSPLELLLPRLQAAANNRPAQEGTRPVALISASPTAAQAGSLTFVDIDPGSLLIVDDEEKYRDTLTHHLERHGFVVTRAQNASQALRLAGKDHFDLILLDVVLPDKSGFEVLQCLRQSHSQTKLPVIMATMMDDSSNLVRAF